MRQDERGALDESLQQLALDVIAGFEEAAERYPQLSGGWELHMAPEYYCTVKVAERLCDRELTYLSLEQNIAHALGSGRRTDAEPTDELPNYGRFDIAVWGPGTEGIVGIVEIKEVAFVTYANLKRDVQRFCTRWIKPRSAGAWWRGTPLCGTGMQRPASRSPEPNDWTPEQGSSNPTLGPMRRSLH